MVLKMLHFRQFQAIMCKLYFVPVFSVPFHEDCLHEPSFVWVWTGQ